MTGASRPPISPLVSASKPRGEARRQRRLWCSRRHHDDELESRSTATVWSKLAPSWDQAGRRGPTAPSERRWSGPKSKSRPRRERPIKRKDPLGAPLRLPPKPTATRATFLPLAPAFAFAACRWAKVGGSGSGSGSGSGPQPLCRPPARTI